MAKCRFGKISVQGLFEPVYPFGTDLYGRLFYLEAGGNQILIAAFDFLGSFPQEANRWRQGVSLATGIPADHIWYHELQVHAAPYGPQLTGEVIDRLTDRTVSAVRSLMEEAEPFTCEVVEADLGTEYTMNREQYVAGLGGVTIWSGMDFDEEGRPYSQKPEVMLLRDYHPNLPVFDKPIYFDNPNDPKAYLFVFKNEAGEVIGSISRFAAHPDVAVLFERRGINDQYRYNFDWPGYLSEKLERDLGGISLYLNGPCGDLSTKKGFDGMDTYEDCSGEARRIGETIAARLEDCFERHHRPLAHPDRCRAALFAIDLPMRDSIPYSKAEYPHLDQRTQESEERFQRAIEEGRPAYEVKQLADERWRNGFDYNFIEEKCGFTEEQLRAHVARVTVSVLQWGEYLFVGVPGESLVDMSLWLRSQFTGVKTIPVDQVNGYYGYMATARSLTLGGYTYWASWARRDTNALLKASLMEQMEAFLREGE
ncbi:MAG: hypothetical protein HFJ80_06125 [Clostridiales bacterium]|nr:hypothetical protein [Clostridiales bacterium]